jgi:hypothetical protein
MKRLIKHALADIHLRIRTLIAEAGRKLRAATETNEDEKACRFYGPSLLYKSYGPTPLHGLARSHEGSRQTIICHVALFNNHLSGSEHTESPVPHGCTSSAE